MLVPLVVDKTFLPEIWGLYGAGLAIIFARFAIRIKTVGLKGFQGDDYLALLLFPFWTSGVWVTHVIYYTGTNVEANVITGDLTDKQLKNFAYGSKLEMVAWYSYTALIWILKGCLLFFLHRLTVGLWQNKLIKWLALGCGLSYLVVLLTITLGCLPYQRNWQVRPNPGSKCTFKVYNFLVVVVFNVITDAAILCIPIPILWKLRVPLQRKAVISVMLCSGVFVICAAIIRVVVSLGANPSALLVNRWGFREVIVGVFTVNVPILRPIVSLTFWRTGHLSTAEISHGAATTIPSANIPGHNYEMQPSVKGSERHDDDDAGSEDYIYPKGVTVERSFEVRNDEEEGQSVVKDEYTGYTKNKAEIDAGNSRQ